MEQNVAGEGVLDEVPLVNTLFGPMKETDLDIKLVEQESDPQCWVVAREGRYKGSDPAILAQVAALDPKADGVIRRDVWVSIKYGHAMAGERG